MLWVIMIMLQVCWWIVFRGHFADLHNIYIHSLEVLQVSALASESVFCDSGELEYIHTILTSCKSHGTFCTVHQMIGCLCGLL